MALQVRAQQGDTVDAVCWRHLNSSAAVEATLELNPGLAALGAILPNGTPLLLPADQPSRAGKKHIQLWD